MAKVKVYELARELHIGSKEIISFLSENNIKVTNHMNNLEDSSIELVKNKYMKKETKTITKPETEMKAKEERQTEEKQAHAAVERPKKKKSITAVFNPQNSQQGLRRQQRQQRRPKERARQERLASRKKRSGRPGKNAGETCGKTVSENGAGSRGDSEYAGTESPAGRKSFDCRKDFRRTAAAGSKSGGTTGAGSRKSAGGTTRAHDAAGAGSGTDPGDRACTGCRKRTGIGKTAEYGTSADGGKRKRHTESTEYGKTAERTKISGASAK